MDIKQALKDLKVSEELLTRLYELKEDQDAFHGVLVQHIEDMTSCYELDDDDWTQEMFISLADCISTYVCYDYNLTDLELFTKTFIEAIRYEFLVQIAHRLREANEFRMKDPECDTAIDMTLDAASYALEYFSERRNDAAFKTDATFFMIGYFNACVYESGRV